MAKKKVYLETSVISYLTARPSRDIVKLAKQELTRQWRDGNRSEYDLYVSTPVRDEAKKGDKEAARRRTGCRIWRHGIASTSIIRFSKRKSVKKFSGRGIVKSI